MPTTTAIVKAVSARQVPQVDNDTYLVDGKALKWTGKVAQVLSPVSAQGQERPIVGSYAMLGEQEALEAVNAAYKAYDNGHGQWVKMGARGRIACIERFVVGLKAQRNLIVELLMFEISKTYEDSCKECDRTI